MWMNRIKTALLLGALTGLFLFMGQIIGGTEGLQFAFVLAIITNAFAYYFSDKLVLRMYGAQPLDKDTYAWIYDIVQELAQDMHIPMPTLWLVQTPMANAFATGRNPSHASVAVTTGILEILNKDELRGVLAHELGHVKNRDILVSTVAATIAAAIGYIANWLYYASLWGYSGNNDRQREGNPFIMIIISLLMPVAAALIQLAISRSREYLADETGAAYGKDPLALASALKKLQEHVAYAHLNARDAEQTTTAHLFIVYPFAPDGWLVSLFSTHPPMQERIKRLEQMNHKLF